MDIIHRKCIVFASVTGRFFWSMVSRSSSLVTYAKALSLLLEIAEKGKRNESNMSIHR
jgi:hypothetical protein